MQFGKVARKATNSMSSSNGERADRDRTDGKPSIRKQTFANIPQELKDRPQWVCWEFQDRRNNDGSKRKTKVPINPNNGSLAESDNPETWSTFEKAYDSAKVWWKKGVGYVISESDPYCGIDLDKACTNGQLKDWARPIAESLATYAEESISETGVKLIIRGKKKTQRCRTAHEDGAVEIYDSGRFFALTGWALAAFPQEIHDRQAELDALCDMLFPAKKEKPKTPRKDTGPRSLRDEEALTKLFGEKNGEKWRTLFGGSWEGIYTSQSEADLALCEKLGFYLGHDWDAVDRIFRTSGLMREKWERGDYRSRTFQMAGEGGEVYDPEYRSPRASPASPPAPEEIILGPLRIVRESIRRTRGGKTVVRASAYRGGELVYPITISDVDSSRKEPARQLREIIGASVSPGEGCDEYSINDALRRLIAGGIVVMKQPQEKRGPSLAEIVAEIVPPSLRLTHRVGARLWSESFGREVAHSEVTTYAHTSLVEAARAAWDCPVVEGTGEVDRHALLRALRGELCVLWWDLLASLPRAEDGDLGHESEAGRQFRAAMTALWTRAFTWEISRGNAGQGQETAERASIVSRVRSQYARFKAHTTAAEARRGWRPVANAFDAWWRPYLDDAGQEYIALGMRHTLPGQVGVALPGVVDQASLTTLGRRFGVIDAKPPVKDQFNGGKDRLAIFTASYVEELLAVPSEDELATEES